MAIRITNYTECEIVKVSLPLLIGETNCTGDCEIYVNNEIENSNPVVWPVVNGKFKVLVRLEPGKNVIILKHKTNCHRISLNYQPLNFKRFVRLVYIKCKDDDGFFQSPESEDNSVGSAVKRICLGAQMLQTFTYDKFLEHGLPRKTFHLEQQCHIFTSSLSLNEALKLTDQELWEHFALELMNSNLRVGNDCKFLAFLSFTRYHNGSGKAPRTYREIIDMTKGHVALGGGGLALFGTGCLHMWPERVDEVPRRFGDKRRVDRMKFMDDSANRGYYWSCYATSLGAVLHELGHTFDLGHTDSGIMARGFDDIHKYFIVDMFYCDHEFQRKHNPYYQWSSQHHTVAISSPSSVSWVPKLGQLRINVSELPQCTSDNSAVQINISDVPWRTPEPTARFNNGSKNAVEIGGAFWTRSNALILFFHKWFNNESSEERTPSLNGTTIVSPNGMRVVEFRDAVGTSFHHLEFLEESIVAELELKRGQIKDTVREGMVECSILIEDNAGEIKKAKIKLSDLK